jgi:hypothetical protein
MGATIEEGSIFDDSGWQIGRLACHLLHHPGERDGVEPSTMGTTEQVSPLPEKGDRHPRWFLVFDVF